MMLVWWLALAGLGGWLIAWLAMRLIDGPLAFGVIVGVVAALVCFRLLRPLADKLFVVQINSHWPYLLEYARGEPSCWDRCIEAGARRLVEIARANAADEIVVVGHSGGGVTAPAVVARALELDPDLGRHGPRVVLLTPGSLMPGIGLHRGATRVHRDIARIAVEPSILWIDVQARADILNFYNFDPVGGIGIDAGPARCNPLIWIVRLRDMLAPEFFKKLAPQLVSHALSVHHGERHARALRIHDAGVRAGAGRAMGAARPRHSRGLRPGRDVSPYLRSERATVRSTHDTSRRGISRASSAAALLAEPGTTTRRPRINPS